MINENIEIKIKQMIISILFEYNCLYFCKPNIFKGIQGVNEYYNVMNIVDINTVIYRTCILM